LIFVAFAMSFGTGVFFFTSLGPLTSLAAGAGLTVVLVLVESRLPNPSKAQK
jgi:hypothetical protein